MKVLVTFVILCTALAMVAATDIDADTETDSEFAILPGLGMGCLPSRKVRDWSRHSPRQRHHHQRRHRNEKPITFGGQCVREGSCSPTSSVYGYCAGEGVVCCRNGAPAAPSVSSSVVSASVVSPKLRAAPVPAATAKCVAQKGQCVHPDACSAGSGSVRRGLCPGITVCCVAAPPSTSSRGRVPLKAANPTQPISGRRPTEVHLLYGLFGSVGSSPGITTQAQLIQKLGADVTTTVWGWDQWDSAAAALQNKPGSKHVVIGYSNGASRVQNIADTGVSLDLLVSEDPTIWLETIPLRANVKKAVCFKNTNPMSSIPPVGHASLVAGQGFDPKNLVTIETQDLHANVDTDPAIINTVISYVKAVVQAP